LTLRGYFLFCKEDDEGRLPPGEEDNTAVRKIYRKDWMVLKLTNYRVTAVAADNNYIIVTAGLFCRRIMPVKTVFMVLSVNCIKASV